ncbi:hypothetical protein CK203_050829 [Vitis vinifera]|uniref:C-JID domain-containing protein n=1 Tax=Vitis vinifera TaxID=29760 RepID=A0A438HBN3_VITVI|nr:hypothetical protein CK203_050829 [Vitis vinifera]
MPLDECEDIPENDFAHTFSDNESGDEALNESDNLPEAESLISTELECQLLLHDRYGFSPCVCNLSVFALLVNATMMEVVKCGLQPIYAQDPIVQTEDVDASCLECQRNVEHRKLCLKGQTISLLPIECASEFDTYYFPEILENMENLRQLHLNGKAIKELPSSIEHLNRLQSRCQLLFKIKIATKPGEAASLKRLRACGLNSTCCQLLSLSGATPAGINQLSRLRLLVLESSGIPKWISHHKKGAEVVAKLPQNWYKNDDLFGFVLYSVYYPLDDESENDATYFECGLTLRGHEIQYVDELQFYPSFHDYVVPHMWMIYYPKHVIEENTTQINGGS